MPFRSKPTPPTTSSTPRHPISNKPIAANYASNNLTIGGGVAIFHVRTQRVVVCYHTRDKYWFLPKGRRDAGEESGPAAEREGFEESGYRNRLLPIAVRHRQPKAYAPDPNVVATPWVTEPVWLQMIPQSATTQYLLFWYIAETLPPKVEEQLNTPTPLPQSSSIEATASQQPKQPYRSPPPYPSILTLRSRISQEPPDYEPLRHENTGVDEEEALYTSALLTVDVATEKLRGSIMADVVRKGWEGIRERLDVEGEEDSTMGT